MFWGAGAGGNVSGVRPLSHSGGAGQGCKVWLLSGWSEGHEARILGVWMYSKSGAISAGQRCIARQCVRGQAPVTWGGSARNPLGRKPDFARKKTGDSTIPVRRNCQIRLLRLLDERRARHTGREARTGLREGDHPAGREPVAPRAQDRRRVGEGGTRGRVRAQELCAPREDGGRAR